MAFEPDVVLAAKEENQRAKVEALAAQVPVLVADPAGPEDVPSLWRLLGSVLGVAGEAENRAQEVEALLRPSPSSAIGFVYFVWAGPHMAAGPDTYVSNLLSAAGFANAVPRGSRRYPIVDANVALNEVVRVHFYPDEPYAFALPGHLQAWGCRVEEKEGFFLLDGRIVCLSVNGAHFTWYPSRTAHGLQDALVLHQMLVDICARGPQGRSLSPRR
ncbi:hypothetical protein HRbin09_01426 [bacterium HR09]|nr:hypothetical protein HRbin09_01426 [bacterium HR09]